nr:caspase family protein [Gemmatimonadota bacterium]
SLRKLISDSRPGDILAFQFAGHGYQLADIDGDEEDDTDEALVTFDFENGAFVLDDDIRAVLSEIKAGVNLTCFIDSCHSGSVTRVFELPTPDSQEVDRIIEAGRARFLKTSRAERDELENVHRMFRAEMDRTRTTASRSFFKREDLRWVNFSAAQPTEKALEHQGHGDFTIRAIDLLSALRGPVTNLEFNNRLIERFGSVRAQTPSLDARPLDEAAPFLSGLLAI